MVLRTLSAHGTELDGLTSTLGIEVEELGYVFRRDKVDSGQYRRIVNLVVERDERKVVVASVLALEVVYWPVRPAGHALNVDRYGSILRFDDDVYRFAIAERQRSTQAEAMQYRQNIELCREVCVVADLLEHTGLS